MSLIDSVTYRLSRLLGIEQTGRPDRVQMKAIRRWIRRTDNCAIDSDLRIYGRADALDWLSIGKQCGVDHGCTFWIAADESARPALSISDRVYVGPYSYIGCWESIDIGESTLIGGYSYLVSANHRCEPGTPVRDQGYDAAPIRIGKDVWVGCHSVILPGVNIGDHAVIGAGAIVNRNVPAGEKWAGVPAKKIGVR